MLWLLLRRGPGALAGLWGASRHPPPRPDADWGVLFIEVSGCLPMCGHGTIGVATVLVETGMVEVTEPVTTLRLDTPAGAIWFAGDTAYGNGAIFGQIALTLVTGMLGGVAKSGNCLNMPDRTPDAAENVDCKDEQTSARIQNRHIESLFVHRP